MEYTIYTYTTSCHKSENFEMVFHYHEIQNLKDSIMPKFDL